MDIAQEWPVMADYNGLAAYAAHKGGRIPTDAELRLFKNKFDVGYEGGANVGFRNWHPTPSTAGVDKHGGRGHNGGVWEWTSTVFDGYEGFVPSVLYPGYSADFFDGCHNVVVSYALETEGSHLLIWYSLDRRFVCNHTTSCGADVSAQHLPA
jgi:formylglycine-generating enzyme required for sulfatase activity